MNVGGVDQQSIAASHVGLTAGDHLAVQVFQDSGGPLSVELVRFGATRIG